jgi:hypothetical protein
VLLLLLLLLLLYHHLNAMPVLLAGHSAVRNLQLDTIAHANIRTAQNKLWLESRWQSELSSHEA